MNKNIAPDKTLNGLYNIMQRRLEAAPVGLCPVDVALSFISLCHAQSCGKCAPCRIGVGQLRMFYEKILDGKGEMKDLDLLYATALAITDSTDCAIGGDAARTVIKSIDHFRDDYVEHITKKRCLGRFADPVPCVGFCPAHVDVPGYIACIRDNRPADAVKLIRRDNPFPVACSFICEHPCESRCRRMLLDDAINIRGLKRYAVDNAGIVPVPERLPDTGKKIAVIGAGPSGLTCAYFLSLMGHKVTVFERLSRFGGMLRYGIPAYRLPRELLDRDIEAIKATGVEIISGYDVTTEEFKKMRDEYDAVFVSVGASTGGKANIPGEDLNGVISAVDILRDIGDENYPDLAGKNVVVIGGGNVAMDATRTAVRLGAKQVSCVYRRRQVDMTAQQEEVEGAKSEGVEIITLKAPVRVEDDGNGNVAALWVKPQLSGEIDPSGRPKPVPSYLPEERLEADVVIVAVGQKIQVGIFEGAGLPTNHGALRADSNGHIADNVFAGGDCTTGPASAIMAVAAGKTAAYSIDKYLGFSHTLEVEVEVPQPVTESKIRRGRINFVEREAFGRKNDFECIECPMGDEEAQLESSRCLRCDHYGCGIFVGKEVR